MAVINVRVDDGVAERLRAMADDAGVTLSEFVRDTLMATVVPVYEPEIHGDEPPPETMRLVDRQTLSLLHRILARVLPDNANDVDGDSKYQLKRARILEAGYAGDYWYETAGFSTELSKRDCDRVSDILQMFRIITFSLDALAKEGTPAGVELASRLEFEGFDRNDALEGHMANYVDFQMSEEKWGELKPRWKLNDNGDSHSPMLATYLRMLAEYRRIKDASDRGYSRRSYLLTIEELQRVADASAHPSRRGETHG
jgi:uncharacterized protein